MVIHTSPTPPDETPKLVRPWVAPNPDVAAPGHHRGSGITRE